MYGVTQSFVKRTWFCLPVAVLNPLEFGLVIGSGVLDPRWNVERAAKHAPQWLGGPPRDEQVAMSRELPAQDGDLASGVAVE